MGKWTVKYLNAADGAGLNAWPGAYLWGRVERFAPDQPFHLVTETFVANNGKIRFDKLSHLPENFYFSSMPKKDWHFAHTGVLQNPRAKPRILAKYGFYGSAPSGVGQSFAGIPELVVKDIDGDGFNDFQLENEKWVGYSLTLKKVIVKTNKLASLTKR